MLKLQECHCLVTEVVYLWQLVISAQISDYIYLVKKNHPTPTLQSPQ